MVKKVVIVGAFDRFNYGDLLFPVVIEKLLNNYCPNLKIVYASICQNDLTKYGGKKTVSLKKIVDEQQLNDGDVIILSGGELLGARWSSIYRYLIPRHLSLALKGLEKLVGRAFVDMIARKRIGMSNVMPFILAPSIFSAKVKIAYNTVGGVGIDKLNSSLMENIKLCLLAASYISVRDNETARNLANTSADISYEIAPDSAIAMHKNFSVIELEKLVRHEIVSTVRSFENGYLCFQSAYQWAFGMERLIARKLESISNKHNVGVLLLPLGRASGHDDHIAASRIYKNMHNCNVIMPPEDLSIYEIMYCIANSSCYLGTSLHGAITAMAYEVPRVGLTKKVKKLSSFMNTWDSPDMPSDVSYENMEDAFTTAMAIPKNVLKNVKNNATEKYLISFENMINKIGLK